MLTSSKSHVSANKIHSVRPFFTFRTRYLPKENITFNPNHTASFTLPLGAIFEPSMSVGPEEDMVTSLNLAVAVSECHLAAWWFLTWLISAVKSDRTLCTEAKARRVHASSSCAALRSVRFWSAAVQFSGGSQPFCPVTLCDKLLVNLKLNPRI